MKNKEKFAKEIAEIVCDGSCVAVDKATGNPVSCNNIVCIDCTLSNKGGCKIALKELSLIHIYSSCDGIGSCLRNRNMGYLRILK